MKFSSILNLVLIAVIFVGIYQGYRLSSQQQRLQEEFASLSSNFGEFSEQQKLVPQIIRLKTDEPMVYQWRVYLPPGYTGELKNPSGFSRRPQKLGFDMPWNYPAEFLITQKFKVQSDPRKSIFSHVQCTNWVANQSEPVNYTSGQGQGRPLSFGRGRGSEFFIDRWGEFEFNAVEANGQSIEIADDEISLLRVKIPEQLTKEYIEKNGASKRAIKDVLLDLILNVKKVE